MNLFLFGYSVVFHFVFHNFLMHDTIYENVASFFCQQECMYLKSSRYNYPLGTANLATMKTHGQHLHLKNKNNELGVIVIYDCVIRLKNNMMLKFKK